MRFQSFCAGSCPPRNTPCHGGDATGRQPPIRLRDSAISLRRMALHFRFSMPRMSWPGLFSATGMAARAMGVSPTWFFRWAPLVLNLLYLLPVKVIANTTLKRPRAQWLALAVFLLGNWLDQDYFSPQAVDLLLYLAVIAILVRVFGHSRRQASACPTRNGVSNCGRTSGPRRRIFWLPKTAQSGEHPVPPRSTAELAFLYSMTHSQWRFRCCIRRYRHWPSA